MAIEVQHADANNFKDIIAKGTVLVDFWATWCGPCRMQGKILEELAKTIDEGSAAIVKVDIDNNADLASEYGVTSIPALFVFKDGEIDEEFVGVQQADTLKDAMSK